jgi:hypothetical protein
MKNETELLNSELKEKHASFHEVLPYSFTPTPLPLDFLPCLISRATRMLEFKTQIFNRRGNYLRSNDAMH